MRIADVGIGLAKAIASGWSTPDELGAIAETWLAIETELGVSLDVEGEHDDGAPESMVYGRIFPFLDRTGLILSGADLQVLFALHVDRREYLFSYREWGGYQSEWVNRTMGLELVYLDFYTDTYVLKTFEDYGRYLKNLRVLVDAKSQMTRSPEAS